MLLLIRVSNRRQKRSSAHNDIVDGDEDKFNDVANETHQQKSDGTSVCDFLEFWKKKKTTGAIQKIKEEDCG